MKDASGDHRHCADAADREGTNLVERIRKLIGYIGDDCACHARLDEALARFSMLEDRRILRRHLVRARQHHERIKAILVFLRDIDDLITTEPDSSVWMELAQLFSDVAAIATEGAHELQHLSALRTNRDRKSA